MHLVVDGTGDHDATGLGKFLQPRRDVDPVAIDVGAVHHHISQVDADTKPHAMRLRWVRILVGNFLLDLDRALHGLDDAGELGDHGVAPGVHDPPVMARHQSGNGGAVAAQRPQRSRFVRLHEARISVDIGAQDGGQPPFHLVVGHRPYDSSTSRQMHEASNPAAPPFKGQSWPFCDLAGDARPARGRLIRWHCTRLARGASSRVARGLLGGGCVALGGLALAVMPYMSGIAAKIALATIGIAVPSVINTISHTVVSELTPVAQRGALLAFGTAIATSAGLLAPYIMGSVVETAATPLAGFNTGFMICGVIMLVVGLVGMALIRPERDALRWTNPIAVAVAGLA